MADGSEIEWLRGDDGRPGSTWNPVTGCTEVSPGCGLPRPEDGDGPVGGCYARTFAERWRGIPGHHFEQGFDVRLWPDRVTLPLSWRRPRKIFVNSMSDLFHDDVPEDFIARVFAAMALTARHTHLLLTKRHGRMRSLLSRPDFRDQVGEEAHDLVGSRGWQRWQLDLGGQRLAGDSGLGGGWTLTGSWYPSSARDQRRWVPPWPLPNVWVGVSVEDQHWADIRIPALLETPAAVRWVSAEPLLELVSLARWLRSRRLGWVVVGGQSGPHAKPMHPDWARAVRDQCVQAGVPFFFKQWGQYLPVALQDAPGMVGGRAYHHPVRGGLHAPAIRRPGPSGTMRASTLEPMRPGERTTGGVVMLDADTMALSVGKKKAGRLLDGRIWDDTPAVERPAGVS